MILYGQRPNMPYGQRLSCAQHTITHARELSLRVVMESDQVTKENNILKFCSTYDFWEDNQMTWISVDKETSRISCLHLQPLRGLMSNIDMGSNPNHVWKLSNCINYKLYNISPVFGRWLYTEIPVGVFCREDQIKCDCNNDCFQISNRYLEKSTNYCINMWVKTNILETILQYFGWGGKGGSDEFSFKSYQKNKRLLIAALYRAIEIL